MSTNDDSPWSVPDRPTGSSSYPPPGEEPTQTHDAVPPAGSYSAEPAYGSGNGGNGAGSSSKMWLVALLAAIVGAAVSGGIVAAADDDDGIPTSSRTVTASEASNTPATPNSIRQVLDKVQPAVVSIQVTTRTGEQGSGTGMIITSDGDILTNEHVVGDAVDITVTLDGEKEARPARLLGLDSTLDAAVIRLNDANNLPVVDFAESEKIQVGDEVVAIGNALALPGSPTVTTGIVSAKDRTIEDAFGTSGNLIQTDAAINPGNSGGPLVDMTGRIIGMNRLVLRGDSGEVQNLGFAIAIDAIKPALEDLKNGITTQPAWLGVQAVPLDDDLRSSYDLTPDAGAVIYAVTRGSPADGAGLSRFDVITVFDGKDIKSSVDLVNAVRQKKSGDQISLDFYRGSEKRTVSVTLGTSPN